VIQAAVHGRNAATQDAITVGRCVAILAELTDLNLLLQLWPVALRIARLVAGCGPDVPGPSPERMLQFETQLRRLLDEMGRLITQWRLNHLEPLSRADMLPLLFWEGGRLSAQTPLSHAKSELSVRTDLR